METSRPPLFRRRPAPNLSGGERQLAMLARALAQEPRILLLDEPTSHLDLSNRGRVLAILRRLVAQGVTILFTTHDPNLALSLADQVILMCATNLASYHLAQLRHIDLVHERRSSGDARDVYLGLDIGAQRSKHVDAFARDAFTHIITVCDRVREQCPVLPGDPEHIHWSLADPAAVTGDNETQRRAFAATASQLSVRVRHFLPLLSTDKRCDQGSDDVI